MKSSSPTPPIESAAAPVDCHETAPAAARIEHSHVPVHSRPGTGPRVVVFVAIVACGLAVGFFIRHHFKRRAQTSLQEAAVSEADAPTGVDVVKVEYASPSHLLTLPGEAAAWFQTTVYARVNGYVAHWFKDFGDEVNENDVLARIKTPELDDQLNAAKAQVKADQAGVNVAQTNMDFAEVTYKRYKTAEQGVVRELERDERKAAFEAAKAKLEAAKSQVDLDQAKVQQLTDLTEFKNVVAPYHGIITNRRVDQGDLVTAGSTASNTPLYDIAQYDTIRVYVDVPQAAAPDIKDGMQATATAREFPGRTFAGTVKRTSRSINPAAKTLKVEVDIPNPHLELLPGMYLEVSFQTSDAKPPLRIPASALNFRAQGPQVAVVQNDGTIKFHDVTIVRDLGDFVEIGSGVQAGQMVALNISSQLGDGDKVIVNQEQAAPANPTARPAPVVAEGPH